MLRPGNRFHFVPSSRSMSPIKARHSYWFAFRSSRRRAPRSLCRMAGSRNDTSELRVWLASHLKVEDVPETIWDDLVEEEYVKDAQNLGFPDGREELLRQARTLMNAYRAGAGAGPRPRSSERQNVGRPRLSAGPRSRPRSRPKSARRKRTKVQMRPLTAARRSSKLSRPSNGSCLRVRGLLPNRR